MHFSRISWQKVLEILVNLILILEKRGTTHWIHFAVRPKDNRRKILLNLVAS